MPLFATERLDVSPLHARDLGAFVDYRCHEAVARYQSWDPGYSLADAEGLLAGQAGVAPGTPGEWIQLAAHRRADDVLVGDLAVHVVADQPDTAELGITLAPEHQGRGYATELLAGGLDWAFPALALHRAFARADDRNGPVHRLFERLGFRLEARLVEADWFKGEWTTLRIYAVLDREWAARA